MVLSVFNLRISHDHDTLTPELARRIESDMNKEFMKNPYLIEYKKWRLDK
jgi:hypothetical protein